MLAWRTAPLRLVLAALLAAGAAGCPGKATPPAVDAGFPCRAGESCDDDNPCTVDDRCNKARVCEGAPKECDDGAACTLNSCVSGEGCALTVKPGNCFIDGECHEEGKLAPGNSCRECRPQVDPLRWVADDENQCDDEDPCSSDEYCMAGLCVPSGYVVCSDGDPCTKDVCVPGGCVYAPSPDEAVCPGGKCVAGLCVSTCEPKCTLLPCHKDDGCGEQCGCDEGLACCDNGNCMEECPCYPDCYGKECGPDWCGGQCGQCEHKEACEDGKCRDLLNELLEDCHGPGAQTAKGCPPWLGLAGCCDAEGRAVWCQGDIVYCHHCEWQKPACGWTGSKYRCGTKGNEDPSGEYPVQCGHTCYPPCPATKFCVAGSCEPCTCKDKECGGDACGKPCGQCADGYECVDYACVASQTCEGHCGTVDVPAPGGCYCDSPCFTHDDCCPDVCEQCPELWGCDGCQVECVGKECGSDGCGGVCGECAPSAICHEGECVAKEDYCPGALAPVADDCGDLTFVGCCDEVGRLRYCWNGAAHCLDCPDGKLHCGWHSGHGWYDCGTTGSTDPSGVHPKLCE